MIALKEQSTNQVVDVTTFLKESEMYPEGARVKASFISPKTDALSYGFCIPSWLYLFKTSRKAYPEQFWVEVFAYQFGCLINVPVPPAFVAFDSNEKISGALIEWFYNQYDDEYLRGDGVMQEMVRHYDIKRGSQHNLHTIFEYMKHLKWGSVHWSNEWAKIIIFDALMGNSDRHQGNWGIIIPKGMLVKSSNEKAELIRKLSPAFDNGTSMGHEIFEKNFGKFNIEKYVNNGKPHVMWNLNMKREERDNQEGLILKMVRAYPHCKDYMLSCLQFSEYQVKEILERLSDFKIEPCLSKARAEFMLNLLLYRKNKLLLKLENSL